MKQQHIIGITGGIGSGKSKVSSFISQQYTLPLINLDDLCRTLLQPQKAGWMALRSLLPESYFTAQGELDRQHFRQQLFTDSSLRAQVDATLHPLACQEMKNQVTQFQGPVLIEIPLLFEAGWQKHVDVILVIFASTKVCLQRVIQRDNVSGKEAENAIAAQQCLREKAAAADHVIDNSDSWSYTREQIQQLVDTNAFFTKRK
jgi:dephospho-CoA kinase